MSEMRLRHRKPIDSSTPQINEPNNVEISEFESPNAQDFARNSMQLKKPKFLKAKSPVEQSKRYAEILCQFVETVNKDYEDDCNKLKRINEVIGCSKKEEEDQEKVIKDENWVKNVKAVSKEEENIGKEQFLNSTILSNKQINNHQSLLNQNLKNTIPPAFISNPPLKNYTKTKKLPISTPPHFDKPKPNLIPSHGMAEGPQITSTASLQQLQQYQQLQQMQQIFQNPLYGMNPVMYSMYPYQMMNYQYYMEQLKQNPYAMQGMMGTLPSGMNSNYSSLSKEPLSRNLIPEPKKEEKQEQKQQPPMQEKKEENKIMSNEEPELKPGAFGSSGNQPIDFKKKSCYHVAISYNIHFARMKEKGLFGNLNSQENLEKLDPTFPAKKIRQNKVSNINDNTSI